MRRTRCTLAALLLAACAGDSTGPAAIDPASLRGRWLVQIDAAPGCWPASGSMYLDVPASAVATGGSIGGGGEWGFLAPDQRIGAWTGEIRTDGKPTTLTVWKQMLVTGAAITGQLVSPARITGTFADQGAFALRSGCASPVTLTKAGA